MDNVSDEIDRVIENRRNPPIRRQVAFYSLCGPPRTFAAKMDECNVNDFKVVWGAEAYKYNSQTQVSSSKNINKINPTNLVDRYECLSNNPNPPVKFSIGGDSDSEEDAQLKLSTRSIPSEILDMQLEQNQFNQQPSQSRSELFKNGIMVVVAILAIALFTAFIYEGYN